MDFIILSYGQITRTTSELALLFLNFRTTQTRGRLAHDVRFTVYQGHISRRSSVESGFELGALRLQSRDISTKAAVSHTISEETIIKQMLIFLKIGTD
ncbi:hypothetical protein AVEN_35356-1 [Araneus ventricosus]|uniref:Uncharacterized protein n=1 Tax=Araneus ventricosus TaxID=182803 RepID=A0A4Y2L7C4_ARAVE|nr:hypothetical protein AVEN_35356-1 [Araneus ventricosus]